MKRETKRVIELFSRYILILLLGLGNLFIFYKILTPLTKNTIVFILNLFSKATITGGDIIFNSLIIELIPACIAGSAYYMLFILVFSIPNIKLKKRIGILLFSFFLLFILNISRIIILILLKYSVYFDAIHKISWYGLSIIFVAGIWILSVKIFKIKDIPFYTDLEFLYKLSKNKTKKSK